MAVPQSTTSQPQSASMKAMVPPPPWSTLPSSPICQATPASLKIFRTFWMNSLLASLLPPFPRAPVYLVRATPYPRSAELSFSVTSGNMGSMQLFTSADSISLFSMVS